MSPYGNRDEASSRTGSIKTACTSRLWCGGGLRAMGVRQRFGGAGRERQAIGDVDVDVEETLKQRYAGVWRLSNEMVGLCSVQHQSGLDALREACLIGCRAVICAATCTQTDQEHKCPSPNILDVIFGFNVSSHLHVEA